VRCRACQLICCAECGATPYHKGHTCASWEAYKNSRQCRFCAAPLGKGSSADVCAEADCQEKLGLACDKTHKCGCPCGGVKGEAECLPCLRHDLDIAEEFCGVCYVEALSAGPCVRNRGPKCTHVFHFKCVRDRLAARWPGARVTFDFLLCPVCKQEPILHSSLNALLTPLLQMEKEVSEKALMRLKYEGREQDQAVADPEGQFYRNVVAYALNIFLFYECYTCKRPYFAGGYQCQEANAEFDPKELVCPACQPSSITDCKTHGKDWLTYKCRFCCSVANWYCWGNAHFCDKCHKSGVWQTLITFRAGKNKKKIWEYPQCEGLKKAVEAVKNESSLSDEQKMLKLEKLTAEPLMCPLGARHPPNGFEFGLGCCMCSDPTGNAHESKVQMSDSDVMAFVKSVAAQLRGGERVFSHAADFDTNGILAFLGTRGLSSPWSNPCDLGLVRVTSSDLTHDSAPVSAAVGITVVRCVTKPVRNAFFCFDLLNFYCTPSHYTLRHYSTWDVECLRHWVFEASVDGVHWDVLLTHKVRTHTRTHAHT
jgi:hypothetical protein